MTEPEGPVITGIRWILQNRTHEVGGVAKPFNPSSLARAAGLNRGHVEQLLARRHSGNLTRDVATKIARAGDVRLEWLLTGVGEPGTFGEPESAPRRTVEVPGSSFNSLEQYIELAGEALSEAVARTMRKEFSSHGTDPGYEYWKKRALYYESEKRQIRTELREVGDALEDEYENAGPK